MGAIGIDDVVSDRLPGRQFATGDLWRATTNASEVARSPVLLVPLRSVPADAPSAQAGGGVPQNPSLLRQSVRSRVPSG